MVWALAFHSPLVARADAHASAAFLLLGAAHPALATLARDATELCRPGPYTVLAALPILVALLRRRWVLAAALLVAIPGAILSAELLKALISAPRPAPLVAGIASPTNSWPSGHSTASMMVALSGVLVCPRRWRPLCAVAGGLFTVAVMYSVLTLGWHLPSDVLGGVLLAALWACLAVAAVSRLETRTQPAVRIVAPRRGWLVHMPSLPSLAAVAAVPATVVLLTRGAHAVAYAGEHRSFAVAVLGVAVLGACVPAGLTAALTGSDRAPRAARRFRSRPG